MRWADAILSLLLASLVLAALLGCAAGDDDDFEVWGDGGTDGDADGDGDVDIEYPEHTNPNLDIQSLMTGPISPPPEHTDELAEPEAEGGAEGYEEEPDED
jgi:hypothetical protein